LMIDALKILAVVAILLGFCAGFVLMVRDARKDWRKIEAKQSPTPESRYVEKSVRDHVFRRDRGACVNCGRGESLEYDHIIPLSRGGATSVNNLQLLCRPCNRSKGNRAVH